MENFKDFFKSKNFNFLGEMFFLQREVILRDLQINELNMSVSDMKGKFIKPTLIFDWTDNLATVKRTGY